MDWQPIETAPKDGTEVLFLLPDGRPTVGRVTEKVIRWNEAEKDDWYMESRSATSRSIHASSDKLSNFTHWTHLPPRPTTEGATR